ncbi:MAG: DUF2807 domain-containing protein [Bacteroidetes bacterium]|nr:DUF2807 domain-containing protein [Bacteroidota bacterium]
MKNFIFLLFTTLLVSSCSHITGSGNIVTEQRNTGAFTKVITSSGFEVEIKKGDAINVTVEADDNIIKKIITEADNGVLRIKLNVSNVQDAHLKVYITAPGINSISASSGSDVTVKDTLKNSSEINLEASSGATISSYVDAPTITANTSSAGEISVKGRTKNFNAESSSGATINALELLTENTTATVSSGADARVQSSVSLTANASSGGSIHYKGGGGNVKINTSSGGSVNKE